MYGWGGLGALNCPGDPGCPGYVAPEPMQDQTQQQIADVWDYLWNGPGAGGGYGPGSGSQIVGPAPVQQSGTAWLNANAGKVALGVGGFFALMLFAKAGR